MTPTNDTHSALHKALKHSVEKNATKLSSNFTYLTMLKVNKLSQEMERKRERRSLLWTIAIAAFMLISGITILWIKFGTEITRTIDSMDEATIESFSRTTWTFSPFLIIFMSSVIILLIGDHLMRRIYLKHHTRHKND